MNNTLQVKAIKRATMGLIADNVPEISMDDLQARVDDQCDRLGCYKPAFPALIDILGDIGCLVVSSELVMLPASIK